MKLLRLLLVFHVTAEDIGNPTPLEEQQEFVGLDSTVLNVTQKFDLFMNLYNKAYRSKEVSCHC